MNRFENPVFYIIFLKIYTTLVILDAYSTMYVPEKHDFIWYIILQTSTSWHNADHK